MLRWITLISAVVLLTAVATYYAQNSSNSTRGPVMVGVPEGKGPQPKWEISQPLLFEFGVLPQNTKHSHSWEVKNAGEGDLEMWMNSSTCSCTIAKLATKEGEETKKVIVKPKDATTIDLEWETKPGNTPDYGKECDDRHERPDPAHLHAQCQGQGLPTAGRVPSRDDQF